VHFKVAREFVERVQQQCAGQEVLKGVTPGQQIVKIIHDELVRCSAKARPISPRPPAQDPDGRPARLGQNHLHRQARPLLKKRGYRPLVVACDVYRPAAIDQLEILAKQEELGFYCDRTSKDVPAIGVAALAAAKPPTPTASFSTPPAACRSTRPDRGSEKTPRAQVQPDEVLLVADGALGQEAVNVAKTFHDALRSPASC
jgi:signal recognition particle subunit SRP54